VLALVVGEAGADQRDTLVLDVADTGPQALDLDDLDACLTNAGELHAVTAPIRRPALDGPFASSCRVTLTLRDPI
jgi:hypothetical protein